MGVFEQLLTTGDKRRYYAICQSVLVYILFEIHVYLIMALNGYNMRFSYIAEHTIEHERL